MHICIQYTSIRGCVCLYFRILQEMKHEFVNLAMKEKVILVKNVNIRGEKTCILFRIVYNYKYIYSISTEDNFK